MSSSQSPHSLISVCLWYAPVGAAWLQTLLPTVIEVNGPVLITGHTRRVFVLTAFLLTLVRIVQGISIATAAREAPGDVEALSTGSAINAEVVAAEIDVHGAFVDV